MIDIHSHILPGIDDGPARMDETLEMARAYEQAGFHVVIATPHHVPGTSWNPAPETVQSLVSHVNRILVHEGMRLRLLPGMEVGLDLDLARMLSKKALLTLGGTQYVLVETPFQRLPLNWEQMVFDLTAAGFAVVWAHPERCRQLQNNPAPMARMLQMGCFLQINWGSILGYNGGHVEKSAKRMLQKGWVHCLATDCHDAVSRTPAIGMDGMRILEEILDPEAVGVVAHENPVRILQSKPLTPVMPVVKPKKESGMRRLFSWKR